VARRRRRHPDARRARDGPVPPSTIVEAPISEMRVAMEPGQVTSKELVRECLVRIATCEKRPNATIAVKARALEVAEARDRESAQNKIRGALHGILVALKDTIQTADMPTTGAALSFAGLVPPYEATLTQNLREKGAVIVTETVITELAN
jgi:amidase